MYKKILLIIFLILILCIYYTIKKSHTNIINYSPISIKYKGICIFDIDGTLTTGTRNYDSIQQCIDNGYAVGISTAGAVYSTSNLCNYPWLPDNLCYFLQSCGWVSFNNVASGILMGKNCKKEYQNILNKKPNNVDYYGWLKGYSIQETAKAFGIYSDDKIVMFDDDPGFLSGLRDYNPDYTLKCAGKGCGISKLTPEIVKEVLDKLKY